MKAVLLLFSLSLLLANACEDAATFPLGESFTMSPQQELVNKSADMTIKWLKVSEDSRCPKNTNCVWEGQAKVDLLINGDPVTLILRSGKPEKAQALVGEYIFTAESLNPYPQGDKIDPVDYRLQLKVSSL